MNTSNKKRQREISTLWNLEKHLGIPIWHNYLALPDSNGRYSASEIKLQQQINFIFNRAEDPVKSNCIVFLSDKTDLEKLFQILPFISSETVCYLCNDQLIQERLSFLNQTRSFASDNKTTKQLLELLEIAAVKGASDIHLESLPDKKIIRIRINGKLEPLILDEEIGEPLFSKIKLISQLDIAQKRKPQDGHFPFTSLHGKRFDMRTATVPSVFGEKIVVRLLPVSTIEFSMNELGFSPEHRSMIQKHISKQSGMVLFTGPTGSGKTTSLYAILNELMSESINIVTIEDPVEYRLNRITQVEVNEAAGISFSNALKAFLRQDPDVILVGEIRDQETAQIAARSAQTGHLVLSTLHSNNAFETIRRLQNLGVENDDIASSLKLIVSQRLVPQKCRCQVIKGCNVCLGTGINGRIPIMEVLEITSEIGQMLSKGLPLSEIKRQAEHKNHLSLKKVGEALIEQGRIARKEFDAVCV